MNLPLFFTRKEVFEWLVQGKKTIEVRKGNPKCGEVAVFQSGRRTLRMMIMKKDSGHLEEILRLDNYKAAVPSAMGLGDAIDYLQRIYGVGDGVFTVYYIGPLLVSEKS